MGKKKKNEQTVHGKVNTNSLYLYENMLNSTDNKIRKFKLYWDTPLPSRLAKILKPFY